MTNTPFALLPYEDKLQFVKPRLPLPSLLNIINNGKVKKRRFVLRRTIDAVTIVEKIILFTATMSQTN